jgi:hypothetical protein
MTDFIKFIQKFFCHKEALLWIEKKYTTPIQKKM